MRDEKKTKAQLIDELAELRQQVAEVQRSVPAGEAAAAERVRVESRRDATPEALQKLAHELGERVKELNCLYGISNLVEKSGISLEEIIQGTVGLLPPAWQYPEITCARIILEGRESARTENFRESPWKQTANIVVHGERIGTLEVCYLEERPASDEGPFLEEERSLINAVAERLGRITERARAEEQLRILSSVVEQSTNSIAILDVQGRVEYVNRSFFELNEFSPEEVVGQPWRSFVSAFSTLREKFPEIQNTVLERGATWRGEVSDRTKSGELIWREATLFPVRDAEGRIARAVYISQDITERKRAESRRDAALSHRDAALSHRDAALSHRDAALSQREAALEALRESEGRYRGVVEDTPVLICCFLPDGEITFVNKTYCEYFDKTPEELVASNFLSLIPESDRETVMANVSALTVESPTQSHEHQVIAPGGDIRWQRWTNRALFDAQGKVVAYQSIGEDITERVRAESRRDAALSHRDAALSHRDAALSHRDAALSQREAALEALRESEEKHRALFETMAQGVVYQAADGSISSANPAAERILGLTLDQMQGRTSMDPRWKAIHEDGSDFPGEAHPSMVALKSGKEVLNVVMGVFNPLYDEYRWININAVPQFKAGEKTPYQVYATFDDVTQRVRAEEERERLIAELQEALDNIKTLRGLIPICANCKNIRDDEGYWQDVAVYVRDHSEAEFTHGICPDCAKELYPEFYANAE